MIIKLNELIHEVFTDGRYDPNIFKAIFIVGASEASKSYMIDKLVLTSYGLKLVDSDDAFTYVLIAIETKQDLRAEFCTSMYNYTSHILVFASPFPRMLILNSYFA